jgi:hypothetical protein
MEAVAASSGEPVRVLAYSAIRNEAFALVREDADRPTRLRRWSAAMGLWTWN